MREWNWKLMLPVCAALFVLAGCDSNPTNEPTPDAIKAANIKRAAAIDADPSMNAEQKAKMKEMLHLNGAQATKNEKH